VQKHGLRLLRDPFTSKPNVLFYAYMRVGGGVASTEIGVRDRTEPKLARLQNRIPLVNQTSGIAEDIHLQSPECKKNSEEQSAE
jgi:hypothetical protein